MRLWCDAEVKRLTAAALLADCSRHAVEHYVASRDDGELPAGLVPVERVKVIDPFLPKLEEWVGRSRGAVMLR